MKYYVYISDSKVAMLYNQIASSTEKTREASIGFDVKILKGEIKHGRGIPENSVTQLNEVVDSLRNSESVGSIDSPKNFIGGSLKMVWSSYGWSVDSPITFWSYSNAGTALALAGSKYNLLGEQRGGQSHSHSLTPMLVKWFLENLKEAFPSNSKDVPLDVSGQITDYEIANATSLAAEQATGPQQSFEFVAKVLHDSQWPQGFGFSKAKRILLASPLYVALAE